MGPDGLIAHVFGPIEGRLHDETVYQMSGLPQLLDEHSWDPLGQPLVIYGDPAYGLSSHLISPFSTVNIEPEQECFNREMSRVRQAVEWGFGAVIRLWAYLDFPQGKGVLKTAIGLHYLVAVLLTNAHGIFNWNQVAQSFDCAPPTLAEYFCGRPSEADNAAWELHDIYTAGGWESLDVEDAPEEVEYEENDDGEEYD